MEWRLPALIGIDGTGTEWFSRDREAYRAEFENSHVRYLCDHWRGWAVYMQGPTLLGLSTDRLATRAVTLAKSAGRDRIVLAGYSRGGAAAIVAAQELRRLGIAVECLVLFDAVDRSPVIGSTTVPANVGVVIHAKRDPKTSSRETFGNIGHDVASRTTVLHEKTFMGTHGAIGGVLWPEPKTRRFVHPKTLAAQGQNWPNLIDEGGLDGKTHITHAQDRQVAAEVRDWVRQLLGQAVPDSYPLRTQPRRARRVSS